MNNWGIFRSQAIDMLYSLSLLQGKEGEDCLLVFLNMKGCKKFCIIIMVNLSSILVESLYSEETYLLMTPEKYLHKVSQEKNSLMYSELMYRYNDLFVILKKNDCFSPECTYLSEKIFLLAFKKENMSKIIFHPPNSNKKVWECEFENYQQSLVCNVGFKMKMKFKFTAISQEQASQYDIYWPPISLWAELVKWKWKVNILPYKVYRIKQNLMGYVTPQDSGGILLQNGQIIILDASRKFSNRYMISLLDGPILYVEENSIAYLEEITDFSKM